MFSGIIRHQGLIEFIAVEAEAARISVRSALFESNLPLRPGDSIAVNGVCLTVLMLERGVCQFELASETLRRSTLGNLKVGAELNLESSLRFGEPVDGHLVQGHVDAVAEVLEVVYEGETLKLRLTLPEEVKALLVPKGSVALDGVSLTVGEVDRSSFTVYLLPYTVTATNFKSVQAGRLVNIEADCLARYVASITAVYLESRLPIER